jgi:hypothetical protein
MQGLYKTLDWSNGIKVDGRARRDPMQIQGPSQCQASECRNDRDFSRSISATR